MGSRLACAVLLILLVIVHVQLWFGRGSLPNVATMQRQLDEQKAHNAQARLANDQLAAEVRDLKEGLEMVEERARMELGMVRQGEIFVQIARPGTGAASAPRPSAQPAAQSPAQPVR